MPDARTSTNGRERKSRPYTPDSFAKSDTARSLIGEVKIKRLGGEKEGGAEQVERLEAVARERAKAAEEVAREKADAGVSLVGFQGEEPDVRIATEAGKELVASVISAEDMLRIKNLDAFDDLHSERAQWLMREHPELLAEEKREDAVKAILNETVVKDREDALEIFERARIQRTHIDAQQLGWIAEKLDDHPEWVGKEKELDAVTAIADGLGIPLPEAARKLGWAITEAKEKARTFKRPPTVRPPATSALRVPHLADREQDKGKELIVDYLANTEPDKLKPENYATTLAELMARKMDATEADRLIQKARERVKQKEEALARRNAPPASQKNGEREVFEIGGAEPKTNQQEVAPSPPRTLSPFAEKHLLETLAQTDEKGLNPLDPFMRHNAIDLLRRTYNISVDDAEKYLDRAAAMKIFTTEQLAAGAAYIANRHADWLDPANRETALDAIVRINHNRYSREEAARMLDNAIAQANRPAPRAVTATEPGEPLNEEGIERVVQWILQYRPEQVDAEDRIAAVQRLMQEMQITEDEAREVLRRAWFALHPEPAPGTTPEPRPTPAPEAGAMTDEQRSNIVDWVLQYMPNLDADPAKADEQIRHIVEKMRISEAEAGAVLAEALHEKERQAQLKEQIFLLRVPEARTHFVDAWETLRRKYTEMRTKQTAFTNIREALFKESAGKRLALDLIMNRISQAAGLDGWASADEAKRERLKAQLTTAVHENKNIPTELQALAIEAALARANYSSSQKEYGGYLRRKHLKEQFPDQQPEEVKLEAEDELALNLALYEKLVLEENEKLNQEALELFEPEERATIVRYAETMVSGWRRIPAAVRWGIIGVAGGGFAMATGAGAFAIAGRLLRPFIGGAAAMAGVGLTRAAVFNPLKKKAESREEESVERQVNALRDVTKDLDEWKKQYYEILQDRAKRETRQNWIEAGLAFAIGGLTAGLMPRLSGVAESVHAANMPGANRGVDALTNRPGAGAGEPGAPDAMPGAKLNPLDAQKLAAAETVGRGEGIWHAVREQLRLRAEADPSKFGLKAEDMQNPAKVRAVLDQETGKIIQQNKMMNLGISREGVKVILRDDNSISFEGDDPTYVMRSRVSQVVERPRASVVTEPPPQAPTTLPHETLHVVPDDMVDAQEAVPFQATPHDDLPSSGKQPIVQDVRPAPAEPLARTVDVSPPSAPAAEVVATPQQIDLYVEGIRRVTNFDQAQFASTGKLKVGDFLTTMEQQPASGTTFTFEQGTFTADMSHARLAQILEVARKQMIAKATFGSPAEVMDRLNKMSVDELLRKSFETGALRPKAPIQ